MRINFFIQLTMSRIGANLLPMFTGQSLISGRVADDRCKGFVVADGGQSQLVGKVGMFGKACLVCLHRVQWIVGG